MNIRIESIHFVADKKLKATIEKRIQKLLQYYDRITNAIVHLKLKNSGQVKDKIIEIKLMVPGEVLVASGSSKTFENALDQTLSTIKRNLVRYKETRYSRASR